jgi:hypothetical protein
MITLCPHCQKEIDPAALMAARARGVKKNYSPEEIQKRIDRLALARAIKRDLHKYERKACHRPKRPKLG